MNYTTINTSDLPSLSTMKKPKTLYIMPKTYDETVFTNCIAIVGSRRMTSYGREVIEKIIPHLVIKGKTIVSGFMYGVDQYAHDICVQCGGKTIAVLGWGIAEPFKDIDAALAKKIIDHGGVILSEWEHQQPSVWTFPLRNRIIVGLSQEVIMIEAAEKSGSLITADLAIKMKKLLWAVPGPITSVMSKGTNKLIAEGKAKAWIDMPTEQQSTSEHPLVALLAHEPLTANELARKTNQPIEQVSADLTMLVLSGAIVERNGKYSLS